jgi:hypothetical protein
VIIFTIKGDDIPLRGSGRIREGNEKRNSLSGIMTLTTNFVEEQQITKPIEKSTPHF